MNKYAFATVCASLFINVFCPVPAHADGAAEIDKLAGVYKHRFDNGLIDGSSYKSEDVFEFVGVDGNAAYFKIHLEFYNGHECNVAGIARYHKGGFVFQDPDADGKCALAITSGNKKVMFSDESGNCHKFCGARGGFSEAGFDLGAKRPIRYMPVILKSKEYREAVEAYHKDSGK